LYVEDSFVYVVAMGLIFQKSVGNLLATENDAYNYLIS